MRFARPICCSLVLATLAISAGLAPSITGARAARAHVDHEGLAQRVGRSVILGGLGSSAGGVGTWSPASTGSGEGMGAVDFPDKSSGWAVGTGGTILHTDNGGTTWVGQRSNTSEGLSAVDFVDPSAGWAVGYGDIGTVLHTVDGGDTWAPQSSNTSEGLSSVCFVNATTGWVSGAEGTILHTSDGGSTWVTQTAGTSQGLNSVDFADASNGWVVGSNGTILHTPDGGVSWMAQNSNTTDWLTSVDFVDANNGWAVGYGLEGRVLHTSDGGVTWSPQASGTSEGLTDVSFVNTAVGWAVGTSGTILTTSNGGQTWIIQASGTADGLTGVCFRSQSEGWAAGDNGTILRYTVSEPIKTYEIVPSAGPHGIISPATTQTVPAGSDSATFTITPDVGYNIADVTVDGASIGASTSVTFRSAAANHRIAASFAVRTNRVTPSAGPHGTIVPGTPQIVDFGSACPTFTITPHVGYHIADVTIDGASIGASSSVQLPAVTADCAVHAVFAINTYRIVPRAGAHGSISPAATQTVDYGADRTFIITPNTGYHVESVKVDGASVSKTTRRTFTNVTADHTLAATFGWTRLPTDTTLRTSAKSVVSGRYVTLTASLAGGTFAPGTALRFEVKRAGTKSYVLLKTIPLIKGVATYRYKATSKGVRYHRVRFVGNSKYLAAPVKKGIRLVVTPKDPSLRPHMSSASSSPWSPRLPGGRQETVLRYFCQQPVARR